MWPFKKRNNEAKKAAIPQPSYAVDPDINARAKILVEEKELYVKHRDLCLQAGICPKCGSFVKKTMVHSTYFFTEYWDCTNCFFKHSEDNF